jgi:hypothetical protein
MIISIKLRDAGKNVGESVVAMLLHEA